MNATVKTAPMSSPLDGNGVAAALAIPLVGQFWPGETAMESEDTNWLTYKRERYEQIISAYLAAPAFPLSMFRRARRLGHQEKNG